MASLFFGQDLESKTVLQEAIYYSRRKRRNGRSQLVTYQIPCYSKCRVLCTWLSMTCHQTHGFIMVESFSLLTSTVISIFYIAVSSGWSLPLHWVLKAWRRIPEKDHMLEYLPEKYGDPKRSILNKSYRDDLFRQPLDLDVEPGARLLPFLPRYHFIQLPIPSRFSTDHSSFLC